jgi:TolB protein
MKHSECTANWTALRRVLLILGLFAATAAQGQLKIEVSSGVTDPIPIAIVPFAHTPTDGGFDVAAVAQHDLEGSGRFRAMPRARMHTNPARVENIEQADWRADGNDYVAVGRITPLPSGELAVDFDLVNVLNGQRLGSERFTAGVNALRNAAHRVSDAIYEKILGVRGAFSTRIAYVAVNGQPPTQVYQLIVADSDGENPRMVLESHQPLMSPAWSADGQWLAYVSFEGHHSAIYVQEVRSGERRQVSARAGINGAPAFSPDGRRLALTLGGAGGNPDIYVLDLATQNLTRITDDPAIDTEAVWAPDGNSLYFTSDRAGAPQIYQIGIQSGARPKRITFEGTYNARPRISADGKLLAMVTLDQGAYRIAVQDLQSGAMRVLSRGRLDTSPSFAPNGASLIYADQEGERGVLAKVSVDGLTGQRLKSDLGEVREPVWGPFTQ